MPDPFAMRPQEANVLRLMHSLDALSRRVRELENRDRGIQTLSAYDLVGGQAILTDIGWHDITLDSHHVVDPQYSHTLGTAIITFNVLSRVLITYNLTFYDGSTVAYSRLVLDTGAGYTAIGGSNGGCTLTSSWGNNDNNNISVTVVIDVSAGDLLKLQAQHFGPGGSFIYTLPNASGISIIRLR